MLTKANLRYLTELQQKKYRHRYGAFLVEGAKSVTETLEAGFPLTAVFGTAAFEVENYALLRRAAVPFTEATPDELSRAGSLVQNHTALAVAVLPDPARALPPAASPPNLLLALADVRDPGNVGTILRLADWYGLPAVVCSPTCADAYGPKAVAASMGSFARVPVVERELPAWLASLPADCPVYGADLAGDNVHQLHLPPTGVLVMGSESHGLPPDVADALTRRLHIPRRGGAESLNVAMATAILLDNFFRND